jgi:hypothetical protein
VSQRDLHVGRSVTWPAAIASQAIGVLGMRGAGKSNLGRVVAEELFASSVPFVVFDPIGNWYGIRAGRDGHPGGGIPVPIFGGEHGDVQLDRNSGQKIADLVLDRRLSCVLDLSHADFSETDKRKFLVDFGERLFRRKSRESGWLALIMEEADDYAPQNVHGGEREGSTARTLGMFQRLVKRGRFKGLGALLITQRSAAINKDLLYMVGTLVVFRTTGPRDQDAVGGWVKYNAIGEKVLESLPALEDGEAWVIAPEALGKIERVRFRRMSTYDTGATPEHGGQAKPATLADIDVPALSKELAEAVQRAKAEDPRELRKTIAELRAAVAQKDRVLAEVDKRTKAIDAGLDRVKANIASKPVLKDAVVKRFETAIGATYSAVATLHKVAERANAKADVITAVASEIKAALAAARTGGADGAVNRSAGAGAMPRQGRGTLAEKPAPVISRSVERRLAVQRAPRAEGEPQVSGPQQKILDAAAFLEGVGVRQPNVVQLALFAGMSATGGYWRANIGRLRTLGLIEVTSLTDAGRAVAREAEIQTVEQLHEHVLTNMLTGPQRTILRVLIDAYPNGLSPEELGKRASLEPVGGCYWRANLGRLRSLGLVSKRAPIQALPVLFLEGA